jgi:hypothetical protein
MFGTQVTIRADCARHEIKTGYVYDSDPVMGGGTRYAVVFPAGAGVRYAKVYDDEIATFGQDDAVETLRLLALD